MKVLHYADKGTKEFIDLYNKCELLITCGDLRFCDFVGLKETQNIKPAFGVYGNHDDGCNYLDNKFIYNVHNRVLNFQGLKIGGFQGCLRYNTRDMQYTESEAASFASNFPYVDILILHAGAFGLLDDPSDSVHIGSRNILRYIDEKKPRFVFCGHQYTNAEMVYGSTQIFRSYGARILELDILKEIPHS